MPMRPAIAHPELLDVAESLADDSILLRGYRPGDGEAVFAGIDAHREELKQRLPWPDAHRCAADSEAYARRMQSDFFARRQFVFGIWDRASGEYAGGAGVHAPDWRTPKAEIAISRGRPSRIISSSTTAPKASSGRRASEIVSTSCSVAASLASTISRKLNSSEGSTA